MADLVDEARLRLFSHWKALGHTFEESMYRARGILQNPPPREGWTLTDLTEWGQHMAAIREQVIQDLDNAIQQTRDYLGIPTTLKLGMPIRRYVIPVFPEALEAVGSHWMFTWEAPEWMRVSGFDATTAHFDPSPGAFSRDNLFYSTSSTRIRIQFTSPLPGISSITVTW